MPWRICAKQWWCLCAQNRIDRKCDYTFSYNTCNAYGCESIWHHRCENDTQNLNVKASMCVFLLLLLKSKYKHARQMRNIITDEISIQLFVNFVFISCERGMDVLDYLRIFFLSERTRKKLIFLGSKIVWLIFRKIYVNMASHPHSMNWCACFDPIIHGICAWNPNRRFDMLGMKIPAAHFSSFLFRTEKK